MCDVPAPPPSQCGPAQAEVVSQHFALYRARASCLKPRSVHLSLPLQQQQAGPRAAAWCLQDGAAGSLHRSGFSLKASPTCSERSSGPADNHCEPGTRLVRRGSLRCLATSARRTCISPDSWHVCETELRRELRRRLPLSALISWRHQLPPAAAWYSIPMLPGALQGLAMRWSPLSPCPLPCSCWKRPPGASRTAIATAMAIAHRTSRRLLPVAVLAVHLLLSAYTAVAAPHPLRAQAKARGAIDVDDWSNCSLHPDLQVGAQAVP